MTRCQNSCRKHSPSRRPTDDICDQLRRSNRFRVYEEEFQRDRATILGFEVFVAAPLGSEFAMALEKALEPLMEAQKQPYERLVRKCEEIIACEEAALADRRVTPLPPNWKIRKKSDLPAGLANSRTGKIHKEPETEVAPEIEAAEAETEEALEGDLEQIPESEPVADEAPAD